MAYDANTARRNAPARTDAPVSTGIPFWDMMLSLGKASSQALTGYAGAAEYGARPERGTAHRTAAEVQVIPVGEETLNVGTRTVQGETTRVRRVVVETPVEREVTLREERVIVERRKPTAATATATQGVLSEAAAEMTDTYEVAEVWKSVHVTEEVVLRREVTERTERVRDTVRRDEVVVEHAPRAPRIEAEAAQQDRKVIAPPQAKMPEPEQLAADLKKVAERFEAGAAKAEQAQAASRPQAEAPKATAEQPKTPARPEAGAVQNDKGGQSRKG